ncbi:MAG TPA: HAMP domain-containing sensor histidine kinase [Candidatus Elarobacter sp.]|jgi:signal transduction histidine kinase
MISLRARLTVSYALVVALILILLAVVLTRFAFAFLAQSTLDAVEHSVEAAREVIATDPYDDTASVQKLIRATATRPGVIVMYPPPGVPRRAPLLRDPSEQFTLRSLLGLRPQAVILRDGSDVLIAPDMAKLRGSVALYLESLGVSIVLAVLLAWLVARWITAQALAPLITVTSELRRFAGGDFTQRPVATSDRSEIGELTKAYNGATAQVAAAFEERARVDAQMRRFVADAGHELRTPLTVVSGYLDVLQKGGVDDPAIRERAFGTLRAQTDRMRALVERLMVLARLESPDFVSSPELLDVAEIAAGAVRDVVAARRGDVEVIAELHRTYVLADRGDLHEAIKNLVDNALKYGGRTRVTVEVRRGAERVVVRVRDGGPGIPEAERAHLFERFFRGAGAAQVDGSGLGLAIVQRAISRCGGSVALENGQRGGTTFVLVLPARTSPQRPATPLRLG